MSPRLTLLIITSIQKASELLEGGTTLSLTIHIAWMYYYVSIAFTEQQKFHLATLLKKLFSFLEPHLHRFLPKSWLIICSMYVIVFIANTIGKLSVVYCKNNSHLETKMEINARYCSNCLIFPLLTISGKWHYLINLDVILVILYFRLPCVEIFDFFLVNDWYPIQIYKVDFT